MSENNPKLLILLNNIAKERKLQKYDIKVKAISSGGQNFTSNLFLAKISSEKNDLHLFIKIAAMGEKIRNASNFKIYDTERFIYTELIKKFRVLEDKHNVATRDRLGAPIYYGSSSVAMEEMIVLEDLTNRGFSCHDRMKTVDWEYASTAVTELAKLHALSLSLEEDNPTDFANIVKFLKLDNATDSSEAVAAFWNISKKSAIGVVRQDNREVLTKFLDGIDMKTFESFIEPTKRQILVHGDYRISNLMHGRRDDGSLEVIPVDYQTIRAGSPVVDLYYFIYSGTDVIFRAKYYEKLLDHYYVQLSAAMTRLGLKPDEMYSREDYEFELKEKLPFGLAVAVFVLPVLTVEADNAPKVDENMQLSDLAVQNTGPLFPDRLNGVVDDYVRLGVL